MENFEFEIMEGLSEPYEYAFTKALPVFHTSSNHPKKIQQMEPIAINLQAGQSKALATIEVAPMFGFAFHFGSMCM